MAALCVVVLCCVCADALNRGAMDLTPRTLFSPLLQVDACIIHGSSNSTIDGRSNEAAFLEWAAGGRQWWLAMCGNSTSAGPCDKSPVCVPFP